MTAFRVMPPVHSPVTPGAIASGIAACMSGASRAHAAVHRKLADRFGTAGVLLTDSGTSALALALRIAKTRAPGPVALPAYSCYDVATAADAAPVDVLLYDLDPTTLGPDPVSLERVVQQGAGAVVVTHLYGLPVDWAPIKAITSRAGALLIEDAAQGAGAFEHGRPIGSFGALAVLSFGRGKGVTSGRGGALLANEPEAIEALTQLADGRLSGRTAIAEPVALVAQWLLARPSLYGIPASLPFFGLGETIYRAPHEPRGMSAFALGVLQRSLATVDADARIRRAHAARLLDAINRAGASVSAVQPSLVDASPGYLRLPALVAPAARERFRSRPARRLGIMPGYPTTLADLPGFGTRSRNAGMGCPGASQLVESLVTLPTHRLLSERDLTALERWIGGPDR